MKQIKNIAIRCLTIPSKGYGNFNRSLTLAENLRKNNCHISFIIDYDKNAIKELNKRNFIFTAISSSKSFGKKTIQLIETLEKNNSQMCIIDMREFGESISKTLFQKNIKSILLDDAWCKHAYSDIIINGTNVKSYHNYKLINKNSKLFLGPKYWILNSNFRKFSKKISLINKQKISTIVISMGGSDKFNLTTSVLKAICDLEKLNIIVIIGPFFKNKKILFKNYPKVKLYKSPEKIWKLFAQADIAISSGGNTLFELSCMGIPTLSIPSVSHETKYTKIFHTQKFSKTLSLREKNPSKIRRAFLKILNNKKIQKTMSYSGKRIVDGKGLSRVTKIILNSF